jgi:hypothetical protein
MAGLDPAIHDLRGQLIEPPFFNYAFASFSAWLDTTF